MREVCLNFLNEEKSVAGQINYAEHGHHLHAGKDSAKRLTRGLLCAHIFFFFFLATLHALPDLSSPTRD